MNCVLVKKRTVFFTLNNESSFPNFGFSMLMSLDFQLLNRSCSKLSMEDRALAGTRRNSLGYTMCFLVKAPVAANKTLH